MILGFSRNYDDDFGASVSTIREHWTFLDVE